MNPEIKQRLARSMQRVRRVTHDNEALQIRAVNAETQEVVSGPIQSVMRDYVTMWVSLGDACSIEPHAVDHDKLQ